MFKEFVNLKIINIIHLLKQKNKKIIVLCLSKVQKVEEYMIFGQRLQQS